MKLHPWSKVITAAKEYIAQGHNVYQQFNCEHCGIKQTMDVANTFYMLGTCQECGKQTDIRMNGHNYLLHIIRKPKR
jgi:transcription elongation factor Elf1